MTDNPYEPPEGDDFQPNRGSWRWPLVVFAVCGILGSAIFVVREIYPPTYGLLTILLIMLVIVATVGVGNRR
ncbi:MAG: hypothetical protein WKF77_29885 [Planctomycetaceae bacterium]